MTLLRISFGDVHFLGQAVVVAARRREWAVVRKALWSLREDHRRGTWQPFTFGQYRELRRRRRGVR
jgi:hypothetical protein